MSKAVDMWYVQPQFQLELLPTERQAPAFRLGRVEAKRSGPDDIKYAISCLVLTVRIGTTEPAQMQFT